MSPWRGTATLVAGLALLLTGCGDTTPAPGDGATGTADAGTAGCRPTEHPALQLSSHLVGDAEPPADFSSTPPTSGWHTAAVPDPGRASTALRDAEIVAALEAGLVVVAVAPGAEVPAGVVDDLVTQFPDRLLVTHYHAAMPTPVALLSWGVLQRCDTLDPTAVTRFVLEERAPPDAH